MKNIRIRGLLFASVLFAVPASVRGEDCPMHAGHQKKAEAGHLEAVNARGDKAMGFDHQKTVHHFLLEKNGGVIAVEATSVEDTAGRDAIRLHLGQIAGQFTDGAFDLPMFIHDQVPPGVPVMKEKRKAISYSYEPTEKGGRVRITTRDSRALAAVHAFLKFQISDHATGD